MKKYLVGGAVRDQLLNFPFSEKDWVVIGSTPEEMIKQGYRPVGKDFPVFLHPETNEEYALARTERKAAPGYTGFTFHADPSVSLEEDLERRDLTINAMAQDQNGEVIDPYDGQEDLDQRKLRHVSLAFTEDPVRVLRVARFSARYHHLGFTVAVETLDLMYAMVAQGETKHLVAERIWQELSKALTEKSPQQFFSTLSLSGALSDIFPEFTKEHYQAGLSLLTTISKNSNDAQLRFAAMCHPLSQSDIQSLCKRLGAPNEYRDCALLFNEYASTFISLAHPFIVSTEGEHIQNKANDISKLLKKIDANRREKRFKQLLEGAAILFYTKEQQKLISFWQNALQHYLNVNPQALIEQGYEKADLGEALFQQRIKNVAAYLENHTLKNHKQTHENKP
ncbi:MAG: hypothetical protein ACRBBR_10455 [Cellvibrionaceae bacterium]